MNQCASNIIMTEDVLSYFEEYFFKIGESVSENLQTDSRVLYVQSGKFRVLEQKDGRENSLLVLRKGDYFFSDFLEDDIDNELMLRTMSKGSVLCIEKKQFLEILEKNKEQQEELKKVIFVNTLLFFLLLKSELKDLPVNCLRNIAENSESISFKKGHNIFHKGDTSNGIYVLKSGKVKILINGVEEGFLRAGELFGEVGILNDSGRSADVEVFEQASFLRMNTSRVKNCAEKFHEFRSFLHGKKDSYTSFFKNIPLDFAKDLSNETENQRKISFVERVKTKIRFFPFTKQIDENDCGPACLTMVCQYLNIDISLSEIRKIAAPDQEGMTLKNLLLSADKLGLKVKGNSCDVNGLFKKNLPAILHWEENHWVVLLGIKGDKVRIADPADSVKTINVKEFQEKWDGYFCEIEKKHENFSEDKEEQLGWLQSLTSHVTSASVKIFLSSLLMAFCLVSVPLMLQKLLDNIIPNKQWTEINTQIGYLFLALFSWLAAKSWFNKVISDSSVKIESQMSSEIILKLLKSPLNYFLERSENDILNRVEGITKVRELIIRTGLISIASSIKIILAITFIEYFSTYLMFVFLALALAYPVIFYFLSKKTLPDYEAYLESKNSLNHLKYSLIKGVSSLQAASIEKIYADYLQDCFHKHTVRQETVSKNKTWISDVHFVLLGAILFIVFYLSVNEMTQERITQGATSAILLLIVMIHFSFIKIGELWQILLISKTSIARIDDLLVQEDKDYGLKQVSSYSGKLSLQNAEYYFQQENPLLKNISMEFLPASLNAITGSQGSGKTTLLNILATIQPLRKGDMYFDDINSNEISLSSLREYMGVVFEKEYLFSGSIADNISLFEDEPDYEKLLDSAKKVGIHDFIQELPFHYNTDVDALNLGRENLKLIAFARVLYKNPNMIILDELPADLTKNKRIALMTLLKNLAQEKTIIFTDSTGEWLEQADNISVLGDGEILESGSHEKLMKNKGSYYQIYGA